MGWMEWGNSEFQSIYPILKLLNGKKILQHVMGQICNFQK